MTAQPRHRNVSAVSDPTALAYPGDQRRGDAAILAAAQSAIARACRCRQDQAFDALLDAARHHHLSVLQLARGLVELLNDPPRRQTPLRGAAAIAFEQWGHRLVLTNQIEPVVGQDNSPHP
jgi:hypothetical protein